MAAGRNGDKTGKNQITVEGYRIKLYRNGVMGTEAKLNSIIEIKDAFGGFEAER